ncbi:MAG: C4-dicarboxylate ABC transporter permease [Betaproteobacteria bacterium SG8_39]|nr:MAG: C4-dicarboxylate ABC transporter permease [Betaproteobacteria bacterium SG8_39]
MTETLIAFAILLGLAFARIPIAFAMLIVGVGGFALTRGMHAAFDQLAQTTFAAGIDYELSVVPLFVLMGNFVSRAGMSQELFRAAYTFIGHWRGGLAMSTVVACAGFGSICGSSIATAATMSKVAYPPMRRLGYSDKLSAASICAGGTLGILIPPSTIMVIYGIITETNIGRLFAAGVFPGILAAGLLCLAVRWVVWRDPSAGPAGERSSWAERYEALKGIWGVAVLFLVSIGGIYAGIFTATEGAGIGAFGAFIFALARRALTWRVLREVLIDSARTTSMLFMILIGALVFANYINFTSLPFDLTNFVEQFKVHPIMVVVAICAIYVILGTAMEELSMVLLTVPIFFPLVTQLGFDPVWFGILIVVIVEIGLISPPVGMNLFVLSSLLPEVPTPTLFRGVIPFVLADIVRLGILIAFPAISLWLPSALNIAGK